MLLPRPVYGRCCYCLCSNQTGFLTPDPRLALRLSDFRWWVRSDSKLGYIISSLDDLSALAEDLCGAES